MDTMLVTYSSPAVTVSISVDEPSFTFVMSCVCVCHSCLLGRVITTQAYNC